MITNSQIRTNFIQVAQWMRLAAVANLIYEGLNLVLSEDLPALIFNLFLSLTDIIPSIFLLLAAHNQQNYASEGFEQQFSLGLRQEINYWRIAAIVSIIILFFLVVIVIIFCVTGEFISDGIIGNS